MNDQGSFDTQRHFESLLFWAMTLLGAGVLIPCLILPAWFDYVAQARINADIAAQRDTLASSVETLEKQIQYQEHDPAAQEQQNAAEFGVVPDGVTPVVVDDPTAPSIEPEEPAPPKWQPPTIDTTVRQLLHDYPAAKMFVTPDTRPILMAMGAGLLLMAVVLLGQPGITVRAPVEASYEESAEEEG